MTRRFYALLVALVLTVRFALQDGPRASYAQDGYVREVVCAPQYAWSCEEALNIVWRESRNDATAVNPSSLCAGWWQIHPIHGYAIDVLMDPVFNTQVAYGLWLASGWAPWRASQ